MKKSHSPSLYSFVKQHNLKIAFFSSLPSIFFSSYLYIYLFNVPSVQANKSTLSTWKQVQMLHKDTKQEYSHTAVRCDIWLIPCW